MEMQFAGARRRAAGALLYIHALRFTRVGSISALQQPYGLPNVRSRSKP
jgi:hypothetical protein